MWRFFDYAMPNSMLPIADELFSTVCAIINLYRSLFVRDVSNDNKIPNLMLSLVI